MVHRKPLRSDMAWNTPTEVKVKGFDLCHDLLGKVSLGDMAFLELTDRLPSSAESVVFNALVVSLVEHGITPSTLAARLTYSGAPEALQAAVAAGICGLGSVFVGSMEAAAQMLQEALPNQNAGGDIDALAGAIVDRHRAAKRPIPGLGHHQHKPVDPRAERLFALAAENGFAGPCVTLMKAVGRQAQAASGKELPINVTGAIAAIGSELRLPWSIMRGIGVIARTIGLIGHLREEMTNPLAREIKTRVEEEVAAHRRP